MRECQCDFFSVKSFCNSPKSQIAFVLIAAKMKKNVEGLLYLLLHMITPQSGLEISIEIR